jgi:hypothetical protein
MPLYDTTNLTNAKNIIEYTAAVNSSVSYLLGTGFIVIVAIISFVKIQQQTSDSLGSALSASFISLIVGLLMLPLGLITWDIFKYLLILTGALIFAKTMLKTQ